MDEMMDKIMKVFREVYGEDAKFENGDDIAFQLNDCLLIVSYEDGTIRFKFVGDPVIKVDHTTGFFKEDADEEGNQ